jgi:hypothetical protein
MSKFIRIASLSVGSLVAFSASMALARPNNPVPGSIPQNPRDWNRGGIVRETSTNGAFTDFTVWPTDPQGNRITGNDANGNAWPQTARNVRRDQSYDFVVPAGQIGGRNTADWTQESRIHSRDNNSITISGAINSLDIESVFFDAPSHQYYMDGNFALLHDVLGDGVFIHIPDLFADTNGSGLIDDGDVLYSMVDLRQYLVAPPNFDDNQGFQIVDGQLAGLPGMRFSTTPFSFSASSGWDGGTPYTGDAVAMSYHSLASTPTPEPAALALPIVALGALLLQRRRRAQRQL